MCFCVHFGLQYCIMMRVTYYSYKTCKICLFLLHSQQMLNVIESLNDRLRVFLTPYCRICSRQRNHLTKEYASDLFFRYYLDNCAISCSEKKISCSIAVAMVHEGITQLIKKSLRLNLFFAFLRAFDRPNAYVRFVNNG